MAPYDSDSSDEDLSNQTNVTLGYPDKDSKGEDVSRLGGRPEWLVPDHPPSAALARCKVCKDLMPLLLQLNAELPDQFPGHERRLYVFGCKRKSCRRRDGCVRALRATRVLEAQRPAKEAMDEDVRPEEKKKEASAPAPMLGESLFGVKGMAGGSGNVNPFSTGGAGVGANPFATGPKTANPFSPSPQSTEPRSPAPTPAPSSDATSSLPATFAQALALNNPTPPPKPTVTDPPEPWPPSPQLPPAYPVNWIADAEYEFWDPNYDPLMENMVEKATYEDVDMEERRDGSKNGGEKDDKVVFESMMDKTFQEFADRVGQNPEQVIRYEYGGAPLLYSKKDAVGKMLTNLKGGPSGKGVIMAGSNMPNCGMCGNGRMFEVQVMPHAIATLEEEDEGLDGMEWGTVIVGTCKEDCAVKMVGEVTYVEEWAGVQWEDVK